MNSSQVQPPQAFSLIDNCASLRDGFFAGSRQMRFADDDIRLSFDDEAGEGAIEFAEINAHLNFMVSRCHWKSDGHLRYKGEGWVRFNFCVDANATFDFGEAGSFDLKGSELRVFYQPAGVACDHFIHGAAQSTCVTVSMHRDYLARQMRVMPGLSRTTLANITDEDHDGFFFRRFRFTPAMLRAVQDMLDAPYSAPLRPLFLKAKTEELLCAAYQALMSDEKPAPDLAVKRADLARVELARRIIEADYAAVPTIPVLARQVGLNRNKLSYGFRHLYNMPISAFVAEGRLARAWHLLENGGHSVSQVSDAVGYAYVSAFSAAFKAHFGVLPKHVLRAGLGEK